MQFAAEFAPGLGVVFGEAPPHFLAVFHKELRSLVRREAKVDDPVLKVSFDSKIEAKRGLIRIGLDAAVCDGEFFISDGDALARVTLESAHLGSVSITANPAFDPVRLLGYVIEPLVRVLAVRRGVLFVHASSVALRDQGLLFPAWGHTGKTNTMLALTTRLGAKFLSDDWSILSGAEELTPNPRFVNLFDYNLKQFPDLARKLPASTRFRIVSAATLKASTTILERMAPGSRKAMELTRLVLDRLANARLEPRQLNALASEPSPQRHTATIQLVRTDGNAAPTLERIDSRMLARSMQAVFEYEHTKLAQYFEAFRFGTGGTSHFVQLMDEYGKLLERYLAAVPAFRLRIGSDVAPLDIASHLAEADYSSPGAHSPPFGSAECD